MDQLLKETKDRLRILNDDSDDNLINLLEIAEAEIKSMCGEFDWRNNLLGKNLILEYVRFAFNGATEHFRGRFKPDIVKLSFELWDGEKDDPSH